MAAPFAIKGDKPQWEVVHDLLVKLDVGDTLSYEALSEALGYEFKKSRSPLYQAANRWGSEYRRALHPVPNVGYRVVDAPEHESIARSQHRKSRRALSRSRKVLQNADRTRLTPEERERFDAMEMNLSRQQEQIRRLDRRVKRVEAALAQVPDTAKNAQETADRVAKMEEALTRHGINL